MGKKPTLGEEVEITGPSLGEEVEVTFEEPRQPSFPSAPSSAAFGGGGAASAGIPRPAATASPSMQGGGAQPSGSGRIPTSAEDPAAFAFNTAALMGDQFVPKDASEAALAVASQKYKTITGIGKKAPYVDVPQKDITSEPALVIEQQYTPTYIDQKKAAGKWTAGDELRFKETEARQIADALKQRRSALAIKVQQQGAVTPEDEQEFTMIESDKRVAMDAYESAVKDFARSGEQVALKAMQKESDEEFQQAKRDLSANGVLQPSVIEHYVIRPTVNAANNFVMNALGGAMRTLDAVGNLPNDAIGTERYYSPMAEAADWITEGVNYVSATEGDQTKKGIFDEGWNTNTDALLPQFIRTGVYMAGLVGAGAAGGTKALGLTSYLTTEEDYYREAIEAGLKPGEAQAFSIGAAASTAALEGINPQLYSAGTVKGMMAKRALNAIRNGASTKDALKDATYFVAKEIGGENVQEFAQSGSDMLAKYAANQMTGEDSMDPSMTPQQAAEIVVLTTALSGLMAGGARVMDRPLYQQSIEWAVQNPDEMRAFVAQSIPQSEQPKILAELDRHIKVYGGLPKDMEGPAKRKVASAVAEKERIKEEQAASIVDETVAAITGNRFEQRLKEQDEIIAEAQGTTLADVIKRQEIAKLQDQYDKAKLKSEVTGKPMPEGSVRPKDAEAPTPLPVEEAQTPAEDAVPIIETEGVPVFAEARGGEEVRAPREEPSAEAPPVAEEGQVAAAAVLPDSPVRLEGAPETTKPNKKEDEARGDTKQVPETILIRTPASVNDESGAEQKTPPAKAAPGVPVQERPEVATDLTPEEEVVIKELNITPDEAKRAKRGSPKRTRKHRAVVEAVEGQAADAETASDAAGAAESIAAAEAAEVAILSGKDDDTSFSDKYGVNEAAIAKELNDAPTHTLESAYRQLTGKELADEEAMRQLAGDLLSALAKQGITLKAKSKVSIRLGGTTTVRFEPQASKKPRTLIDVTTSVAKVDKLRPVLESVHIDGDMMVATDAHKMVVVPRPSDEELTKRMVDARYTRLKKIYPDFTIKQAQKTVDEDLAGGLDGKNLNLRTGEVVDQQYPNYKAVIPSNRKNNIVLPLGEFAAQVDGAARALSNVAKDDQSAIAFDVIADGETTRMHIKPEMIVPVVEALRAAGNTSVTIDAKENNRAMVLRGDKVGMGMAMPVMLENGGAFAVTSPIVLELSPIEEASDIVKATRSSKAESAPKPKKEKPVAAAKQTSIDQAPAQAEAPAKKKETAAERRYRELLEAEREKKEAKRIANKKADEEENAQFRKDESDILFASGTIPVDEILTMHSPHEGADRKVSYRGPVGNDKSMVVIVGSGHQMAVPNAWLRGGEDFAKREAEAIQQQKEIDDQLKFEQKNEFEQKRADELQNAPTYQTRNGWEIVRHGVLYHIRDSHTKEVWYNSGSLKRVREVADETQVEAPAQAEAPLPKKKEKPSKPQTGWKRSGQKSVEKPAAISDAKDKAMVEYSIPGFEDIPIVAVKAPGGWRAAIRVGDRNLMLGSENSGEGMPSFAASKAWRVLEKHGREKVEALVEASLKITAAKGEGPMEQRSTLPPTITIDGKERSTTNSKGQPIAQTEEGVRNFWAWFGDSKVVDEQGRPLVVYHGTNQDFDAFDKGSIGSRFDYSFGFHLTNRPEEAGIYADSIDNAASKWNPSRFSKPVKEGAAVMAVYVRAETPLDIKTNRISASMEADANKGEIVSRLVEAKRNGAPHDSVIIETERKDEWFGNNIIVFDPSQIKSATGNSGAFDPKNPDITQQRPTDSAPIKTGRPRLDRVLNAMKGIAPGLNIIVHDTKEAYSAAVAKEGEGLDSSWGVYAPSSNTIHVSPTSPDLKQTLFHETAHPIILALARNNPDRIVDFVHEVRNHPDGKRYNRFASRYRDLSVEQQMNEVLAEFLGDVVSGKVKVSTKPDSLYQRFKDFIKDILAALGWDMRTIDLSKPDNIREFAAQFKKAMDKGIRITGLAPVEGGGISLQDDADRLVNGWYSRLDQAVAAKGNTQSGADWMKWAEARAKEGMLSMEEVKWTGLADFLQGKAKVTPKEVRDFLKENRVKVEVVVMDEGSKAIERLNQKMRGTGYRVEEGYDQEAEYTDEYGVAVGFDELPLHVQRIVNEHSDAEGNVGPTKFSQYQLPGGTNYREVLVTLPIKPDVKTTAEARYSAGEERPWRVYLNGNSIHATSYVTREEADEHVREVASNNYKSKDPSSFRSSHFDEPNILVHLRLNDRVDADGKRILFIEELQSDFGQSLRKLEATIDQDFDNIVEKMKADGVLKKRCP